MDFSLTLAIVVITVLTSMSAFNNSATLQKMIFSPYWIKRRKEYHRFITSGFIHGSWMHLLFNMFVLHSFGSSTEMYFGEIFGGMGKWLYIIMYLTAIVISEIYSYFKHQDNPNYASLGASGAVSAVVFASILINPWVGVVFIFFPFFPIPGFVIGILYLIYSAYMAKKGSDNIGHYAHFFGAIFGFIFPVLFKPQLIIHFFNEIIQGLSK
jgi:membrane associated rhomboid family serine protease